MDRVVHLYSDRSPFMVVLTAIKLGMMAVGLFLVGRELISGTFGEALWIGLVMAAGGAVFGGVDLMNLLDRNPKLTLSADGLLDHRGNPPRVIRWDRIRALGYRGGSQSSGWALELYLTDQPRPVLVDGVHVEVKARELVKLIQDFAPHAEVDKRFRLWIG
jgi:hypothetical protein